VLDGVEVARGDDGIGHEHPVREAGAQVLQEGVDVPVDQPHADVAVPIQLLSVGRHPAGPGEERGGSDRLEGQRQEVDGCPDHPHDLALDRFGVGGGRAVREGDDVAHPDPE
jgi:hypothetical protein